MNDTPRTDAAWVKVDDCELYADTAHRLKDACEEMERGLAAATKELANIKSALGEHPDSPLDIPLRIGSIRDEVRNWFHIATKQGDEITALKQEKHLSDMTARESSDWFDCLVDDLAKILGCENKASAVIEAARVAAQRKG